MLEKQEITTLTLGFWDLRYCPTPETVPPLPIPMIKMSTCPFVSSHISGPVVSKCTCFHLESIKQDDYEQYKI